MRPTRLLAASLSCLALAVVLASAALGQAPPTHKRIGMEPVAVATATPAPTPTPTIPNCPPYYPCETKFFPIPQYAAGTDPLCYGKTGCPATVAASPLPQNELNALALASWAVMRRKVESGELTDKRTSENVPIRWGDAPTVSVCWSSFAVEHPACMGDATNVCTGKVSWVTADPYKPATWRVAIRTDVDADTQRTLVVDGVVNLALMLTRNEDKYNGATGDAVKLQLLGGGTK
jgi:hypothetical protein